MPSIGPIRRCMSELSARIDAAAEAAIAAKRIVGAVVVVIRDGAT
jgi:hypothetical protein